MGIRLIVHIDNILILSESREDAIEHTSAVTYLLECLGYVINREKLITIPTQEIEFLGITVDSTHLELRLPLSKMKKIRAEAWKLGKSQTALTQALARLLGKMNATSSVIPPAPLFSRHLQMSLTQALYSSNQSYDAQVPISLEGKEELR